VERPVEGPSLSRQEKRGERGLPLVEKRRVREERGLPLVEKREGPSLR